MSETAVTDLQLLARYTRDRAEDAFAEIVRRHVDLVHSAALRQVRSPQLAEEVAQSVFTDLARVAATPASPFRGRDASSPETLTPWLYTVTRRTAVDVIRKESRRQLREQIATEMNNANASASSPGLPPAWTDIEPHLDEAMSELDDTDRAAVLLRYFENKSLRDVGRQLGVSDDAAQKRVSRAVERLREFFAKRGVTVGAGGLVVVVSAHAVQAAPVGLAVTISAAALAGTAATTSTVIAAAATTKTIAMTTLQKTLVTATVAVLAGAGIYEARHAAQLRNEVQTLQQRQAPLSAENQRLHSDLSDATSRIAGLHEDIDLLKKNSSELLKLRAEVTRLRNEADALAKDAKDKLALQSDLIQAVSNTPPVRTFVATASKSARWNQAIVTGGSKFLGKRTIVVTQLYRGDDATQLTISSKLIAYDEISGKPLGLNQFNFDNKESDDYFRTPNGAHLITAEEAKVMIKGAENSPGVEIMSVPSVSTLSGRQAQVQATKVHQSPSGEQFFTGPIIDYFPTISADGESVQLVMTVQFNSPTYNPQER